MNQFIIASILFCLVITFAEAMATIPLEGNQKSSTNSVILQEVVDILSERFKTNIQIKSAVQLSEPERRNLVLRITLNAPSKNVPASLILKQSLIRNSSQDNKDAIARFARDWAALSF